MNRRLPNKGAAPNRRLRFGPAPWSFGFFIRPGSAVAQLDRSAASNAEWFEQEATEARRRTRSSVFSVISCWICSSRGIAPTWISFRVFRVFRGYLLGAVPLAAVAASLELWAGDF